MRIDRKYIFRDICKQDLAEYLGEKDVKKTKKAELEEKILKKIDESKLEKKRFFKIFERATALSPVAVCDILQCTKTERLRWQEEGKLEIVGYDSFKYGEYPLFSMYQIMEKIYPDMIEKWREEHEKEKAKNKTAQKEKCKATRKKRAKEKEIILEKLRKMKAQWYMKDCMLSATFELAYWTVWVSRLAKEYQIKAKRGREENQEKYRNQSEECYEMKGRAVFALAKSPYAKLSFYRPPEAKKETLWLCEGHMEDYREQRSYYGYGEYSVWDYFYDHKSLVKKCPCCIYEVEPNYYSLYYLSVSDNRFPDTHFSFHTPYGLGLKEFGSPKNLPQVQHEEQDGMFRFGRALIDEEKYLFTLAFVKKQFGTAFETYTYMLTQQKRQQC